MKGYWNKQEETARVIRDGWLFTGDMGYMDEEGFFYIADRKKDIIIAGGYNIYPREVEEALYEHEAVQEIVVAGVPDSYRGETVKAFIVLKKAPRQMPMSLMRLQESGLRRTKSRSCTNSEKSFRKRPSEKY